MPRLDPAKSGPLALVVALLTVSAPARADLLEDAERVARLWASPEVKVERLTPLFLEHGRGKALAIEPEGAAKAAALSTSEGCTSLVVLGARSAEFTLASDDDAIELGGGSVDPSGASARGDRHVDDRRARSIAGALMLVRCGASRRELARLSLELQSPRGAIEMLVARSSGPPRELRDMLPERASGPVAPRGDPGRPIEPGPLPERLARAERHARREGAEQVTVVSMRSALSGQGEFDLKLATGCHRLEVMAEVPTSLPRRATDVDAELREIETERIIARDRADTPDARLDVCFGEPTTVALRYQGASGAVTVSVSDGVWPISPSIPGRWGARARAGLSGSMLKRRVPPPRSEPILTSLGIQGVTSVPVELVPGTCYLASVALIRGDVRGLRLTARVADRAPHDEVVERAESAAVAFCADGASAGWIEVETRGNSPWWALAVWAMGPASP